MANLPSRPFDGRIFIDAFRVKWVYNSETNCWRRIGVMPDIPVASDAMAGLLSGEFKNIIDGIPVKGGHFGIIARPLPTISTNKRILFRDTVKLAFLTEAGTTIRGRSPFDLDAYKAGEYRDKLLIFSDGSLKGEVFLIFDNSDRDIFLHGNADGAQSNDKFEIVELSSFNPSGMITGAIELVSDSIDITCIDGNGRSVDLVNGRQCGFCDSSNIENQLPGFDFKLSDRFKSEFCAVIPGCAGPDGNEGDKGDDGAPGTGDGPQGEQGDTGVDAPEAPDQFTGIKINDIADIYDTAIVNIELDAANNKLNIIKAKIKTPDSNSIAEQLITTPIDRSIKFVDDEFGYEFLKSASDPLATLDPTIAYYPIGSSPATINDVAPNPDTQVGKMKLSGFFDKIINLYRTKLTQMSEAYNLELKAVIEEKDSAARTILADLAKELAECEWSQPLEFCLGIEPKCFNPAENLGTFPFPMAEVLGGSLFRNATATDLGFLQIGPGETIPLSGPPGVPTSELPTDSAYLIQYLDGAIKTGNGYTVGDTTNNGTKLQIVATSNNNTQTLDFPVPADLSNASNKDNVVEAYKSTLLQEMCVFVQFPFECDMSTGTIDLISIVGEGVTASGRINLRFLQIDRAKITGSAAGSTTSGPDGTLNIEFLAPAVECELFKIEIAGSTAYYGTSIVQSAILTTQSGNLIAGMVGADTASGGFCQVINFGILPIGSCGPGSIVINIGGSVALIDSVAVIIGTEA